jgi:nucleotide-binding universal stress UspA family protein
MIKRILVPTDGSDAAVVGVRYAVALAKRHGGSILGIHVVDIKLLEGPFLRDLSASLGTAPYVDYQGNITLILEERGQAALKHVEQLCAEAGVPCETEMLTGIVHAKILSKSTLADCIVMGRGGEHNAFLEGLIGSTTDAVLRRAQTPVLVTGVAECSTGPILVAYDGSAHARKALQHAVSIAGYWQRPLRLLLVGGAETQSLLAEATEYLKAHDVAPDGTQRGGDPGEQIVAFAKEIGASLIAMGAFGHSRIRELVLGSTTAQVMNSAPCPILLTR